MTRATAALAAGALSTAVVGIAGCGATSPTTSTPGPGAASPPAVAELLQATWDGYRQRFVQGDGRVLDPKRGNASTSEGQSYALLRAAWMDDRDTFATVWRWTRDNLRTSDGLFGYLWGRRPDGSWGPLSRDSATDADQDIALALLVAAQRWGIATYRDAAVAVVRAIWDSEVARAGGSFVATAGNWATRTSPGPTLNPSYFAPYAYRLFAAIDPDHPWKELVDSSYRALLDCSGAPLTGGRSAWLPPNWCALDGSGQAHPATSLHPDADDYGYDAFRVMWRVAVDAMWNHEPRARDYLRRAGLLRSEWQRAGRLAAVYHHDGSVAADYEDVAVYGGDLGNLLVTDPAAAREVVSEKLLPSAQHLWGDPDNYYQQNWAWFGLALAGGRITPPGA